MGEYGTGYSKGRIRVSDRVSVTDRVRMFALGGGSVRDRVLEGAWFVSSTTRLGLGFGCRWRLNYNK